MLNIKTPAGGEQKARSFKSDESGTVVIVMTIALIPILLMIGMAVEWRQVSNTRVHLQNLLDIAVVSTAAELGETGDFSNVQDHFSAAAASALPFTTTHSISDSGGSITGSATVFVPAAFSSILGRQGFNIEVESVASLQQVGTPPACITTLDPSQNQSLILNSGAQINALGCTINVHSQSNPAVIFNSGILLNTESTCIAGSNVINNAGLNAGTDFTLNCDVGTDPLAGTVQEPLFSTCNGHPNTISGPTTLQPGVYCGGLIFNGGPDVEFEPGLYIIRNGNWLVNGGSWEGEGVTFYFEDTSIIQFNSNVDIDLSAPDNGIFEDILFAETPGLPESNFILNDTDAFDISGAIYLPSRNVTINSNGNARAFDLILVVNNLVMNNARWDFSGAVASKLSGGATTEVALIQ